MPLFGAYNHLIAVIKAAIATTASIINLAISNAVGFFFAFFIPSPPFCIYYKKYKFKVSPKTVQDIEHKNTSYHTNEADIAKEICTSCDDDRSEDDIAIKELSAHCIIATEQVHTDTQIPESSANEQNQIRFCRICGTKIPSDSIFCYKCGERVVRT